MSHLFHHTNCTKLTVSIAGNLGMLKFIYFKLWIRCVGQRIEGTVTSHNHWLFALILRGQLGMAIYNLVTGFNHTESLLSDGSFSSRFFNFFAEQVAYNSIHFKTKEIACWSVIYNWNTWKANFILTQNETKWLYQPTTTNKVVLVIIFMRTFLSGSIYEKCSSLLIGKANNCVTVYELTIL